MTTTNNPLPGLKERNRRVALFVLCVIAAMTGLAFASVPLYRLFCQKTGFDGTPLSAAALPHKVTDRIVTIKFNADISPDLGWSFKPEHLQMDLRAGQKGMAAYIAHNASNVSLTGTAVYNVTPPKVGKYFHKMQCFCFAEQTLGPNQTAHMPVVFFIDPDFADDIDMQDVSTITLSYTFFKTETPALEQAMERFYNQPVR